MATPVLRARCTDRRCRFRVEYNPAWERNADLRFEHDIDRHEAGSGHEVYAYEATVGRPTTEQYIRRHGRRWSPQDPDRARAQAFDLVAGDAMESIGQIVAEFSRADAETLLAVALVGVARVRLSEKGAPEDVRTAGRAAAEAIRRVVDVAARVAA
jgi:hypothetical protein